jgi:hypothetical protein
MVSNFYSKKKILKGFSLSKENIENAIQSQTRAFVLRFVKKKNPYQL